MFPLGPLPLPPPPWEQRSEGWKRGRGIISDQLITVYLLAIECMLCFMFQQLNITLV